MKSKQVERGGRVVSLVTIKYPVSHVREGALAGSYSPALREQSGPLTVNNTATITTKRRPYGRNIALVQIVLKNPRCAREEWRMVARPPASRPLPISDDSYLILVFIASHAVKNCFKRTIQAKDRVSSFIRCSSPITSRRSPRRMEIKHLHNTLQVAHVTSLWIFQRSAVSPSYRKKLIR